MPTPILRQSTRPAPEDCLKIGGLASAAIASLLDQPAQPAELIGSYPVAVYLRTGEAVVALVGAGGVRLPNAVALAGADQARVARSADPAGLWVGNGGVQVGSVRVIPGRWWDPVPRLGRIDPGVLSRRLDIVRSALPTWPDRTDPAAPRLREGGGVLAAALAGSVDFAAAARGLVGLGAGLTPAGDDLLAGTIAGLVVFGDALGRPDAVAAARDLASAVATRAHATTALAADLAQHAARGALAQPAAALCDAIAGAADDDALLPVLDRLLAVGHTSGRDLAEGLLLGMVHAITAVRVVAPHPPGRPTQP